jgi:hypothetical protein
MSAETPPTPSLSAALDEIEELARAASNLVNDDELTTTEKSLCVLDLVDLASVAVFPEAARHAIWLAIGDWLYREPPHCKACGQPLPHDFYADQPAWLRRMWLDEAGR